MKKPIEIKHLIHGDLEYIIDGEKRRYIASYSFIKVQERLAQFFTFIQEKPHLCDLFKSEGIHWERAIYGQLFWRVFYPYNLYRSFLERFPEDHYLYDFKNNGLLKEYLKSTSLNQNHPGTWKVIKNFILKNLIKFYNKLILKKYNRKILFFSYSFSDFRSKDIEKALSDKRIHASFLDKKVLISNLFSGLKKPYFFIWSESLKRNISYGNQDFENNLDYQAYLNCERLVNHFQLGTIIYEELLKSSSIKRLFSIDDSNVIFPLTLACNRLKIDTIAIQHGAAYVAHHGSYDLGKFTQLSPELWFRKIITWNEFWASKANKVFNPKSRGTEDFAINIVVGANKKVNELTVGESKFNDIEKKEAHILIPYEFLSNCSEIGEYIMKLISSGHYVYFKTRPDHSIEDQVATLSLTSEVEKKVKILQSVSEEDLIKQIDLILVTQTALLFDLIHLNIPFALMDVEFVLYDFLHREHGVPYLKLGQISESISLKTSNIKIKGLSNPNRLEDVLKEHVLS